MTFCFCSACSSLLTACCGNDKPSTVPPSATSGRKRSVLLLVVGIILSLAFQYGLAPFIHDWSVVDNFVKDAWTGSACQEYENQEAWLKACMGNHGNYRVAFATTTFFFLAAIAAYCKPTANRMAWPAKYVLFVLLAAGMAVVPNEPLFSPVYLNIARGGWLLILMAKGNQDWVVLFCFTFTSHYLATSLSFRSFKSWWRSFYCYGAIHHYRSSLQLE